MRGKLSGRCFRPVASSEFGQETAEYCDPLRPGSLIDYQRGRNPAKPRGSTVSPDSSYRIQLYNAWSNCSRNVVIVALT
jgi:hypothetical protein